MGTTENVGGGASEVKDLEGKDALNFNHCEQAEGHTCVWELGCMGLVNCQLPNLAVLMVL